MNTQTDLAELDCIRSALDGDQDAFTDIVEMYKNPVFNLCYRMLGTPQAAEDAAQEAFWRAYKYLDRYDMNRSFATWLLSITAHYCIDLQRKKKLPTMNLDDIIEYSVNDPAPPPEKVLVENEFSEEVQRQLSNLNEKDRAVLILRYWHEMSEKEISQTLSISKSAVKSRLFRARKHMAEEWDKPQGNEKAKGRQHEAQTI